MAEDTELLERLIRNIDEPLAKIEREIGELEQRKSTLQAERYGLQLSLARLNGQPEPAPTAESADAGNFTSRRATDEEVWRIIYKRTDAVIKVLGESDYPLGRQQITKALHSHGRDDKPNDVSAALAYLHRNSRVVKSDTGGWSLPISEETG